MSPKNKFLDEFKHDLLNDSVLGNLIYTPDTIAIYVVGGRSLPQLCNDNSDIDIICITRNFHKKVMGYALYYKKQYLIHGDYHNIEECSNFLLPLRLDRQKGFAIGLINLTFGSSYCLYLDRRFQSGIDIFKKHSNELIYCGIIGLFTFLWPKNYFNEAEPFGCDNKAISYLLLGYYFLIHKSPEGEFIRRIKYSKYFEINDKDRQKVQSQLQFLYHYIQEHVYNIAHLFLLINDELTTEYQRILEVYLNEL